MKFEKKGKKKGEHPHQPQPPNQDPPSQVLTSHEMYFRHKSKQQKPFARNTRNAQRQDFMESVHQQFPQQQLKHPPKPRKETPFVRQREDEIKIYGENAGQMVFQCRPEDIVRAYLLPTQLKKFEKLVSFFVENKLAYHVVEEEEMGKITQSHHHEGICLLIKRKKTQSLGDFLQKAQGKNANRCLLLASVGVKNPHNIGAMMRSMAHFGVNGFLYHSNDIIHTPAAYRTAEGGAEFLEFIPTSDWRKSIEELKEAGFTLIMTSGKCEHELFGLPLPARCVLFVGEEGDGLPQHILDKGDLKIRIPGTGYVESLNVSLATGIFLAEYWKIHGKS